MHRIPHQLTHLNFFFDRRRSSPATLKNEQRTTQLYLLIWVSVFTILLIYNSLTEENKTIQVLGPTESIFSRLSASYNTSLQCPCTPIAFSYDGFVNVSARLHQLCISPFIENAWISNIFGDGNWSNLATNQFRSRGAVYFLALQSLCRQAQSTINSIIRDFRQALIFSGEITLEKLLLSQVTLTFDSIKGGTMGNFLSSLEAARGVTKINQLMNHFSSNWIFSSAGSGNRSKFRITTSPVFHGKRCSCATSSACTEAVYVDEKIVPGFVLGCYPMESSMRSTFDCLYNRSCIQSINFENSSSIQPLDPLQPSRYQINSTVNDLTVGAFIEEWALNVSYSNFFSVCASSLCTYSVSQRNDILRVITVLLGLYGGLTLILRVVVPWLMIASHHTTGLLLRRHQDAVVPFA